MAPRASRRIIRFVQRRPIQQLPPSLVNRIAAGEVIERPASVVKELIENAIDAGATQIIIETEDGGRELIRVTDNGCGISPADLRLAFAPHATSKLACDEDLFNIVTMGFRGEALASIGAVSQARILSRTADSEAAWEVVNRGGVIGDVQAAAGNVGTTVEVRNLFFNTPARRKFLKGAATESGHISDMVTRLALPHPHIAFKLLSGGRVSLDLPACEPEVRLLAAWPEEFREQRLPLAVRSAEIRISGIIGLPELAHPTARHQYFYLNGRHIRDRFIQHALREGYRGLTEPGRQPAAILLIEMPAHDVDVNVHPTKSEVRFRDSGRIHGLILSAIREKLLGSDLTPTAVPTSPADDAQRQGMRSRLAEFFKQQYPTGSASEAAPLAPTADAPLLNSSAAAASPGPMPPLPGRTRSSPPQEPVDAAAASPPPRPVAPPSRPALQLHNAYLVTECEDGLVIIDQHALHERIMYEELLARLSRGPLESQRLLIPEVLPATPSQIALLENLQPLLGRLGIELAVFGPDSVAVQAFPTFLDRLEPGRFVRELLERAEQELLDLHDEELLHGVLDMMACKAAVKAGDPLSQPEIEALLARRELVERSSNCPHGRPTTLRLTLRDLEKQFKRTGF
jgi:DNA mismatch repair protein MutL